MSRIYLSAPHMGGAERQYVADAFETNWLSTVGPHLGAFEEELSARLGRPTVALASGTSAIHLGLRLLGVAPGDLVLCPTFTFVASVNPIRYLGAEPVFVDCEPATWNICPDRVGEALDAMASEGRRPRAVVVVQLYGQCARMDELRAACDGHGVPLLEDAAEALGATYRDRPAGALGDVAALSFNGNKIITTTGGGALVARSEADADRVRHWATQARDPGVAYEHSTLGYNYRLSNVLAAIGRGQLQVLDDRVTARRRIAMAYRDAFADLDGLELMPQADHGVHTNWLSCFLVDPERLGCSRDDILTHLAALDIEARPVWKPMHMQPLYGDARRFGGDVAEGLFARGLCLPSSSFLTESDLARVIDGVRGAVEDRRRA